MDVNFSGKYHWLPNNGHQRDVQSNTSTVAFIQCRAVITLKRDLESWSLVICFYAVTPIQNTSTLRRRLWRIMTKTLFSVRKHWVFSSENAEHFSIRKCCGILGRIPHPGHQTGDGNTTGLHVKKAHLIVLKLQPAGLASGLPPGLQRCPLGRQAGRHHSCPLPWLHPCSMVPPSKELPHSSKSPFLQLSPTRHLQTRSSSLEGSRVHDCSPCIL